MKRKLIKQARDTLTLTLPSTWAKQNGLQPGDFVEVLERQRNLIVSVTRKATPGEITVDLDSDNPWYVGQLIRQAYFGNFEKTKVTFDSPKTKERIRQEVDKLLGFEIIREEEDYCVIKNVSYELEDEYPVLFRKIFLLTLEMFDEKQTSKLKRLNVDCHRYALFCRRVLARKLDSLEHLNQYILLQRLTMITNNLVYVRQHTKKLTPTEQKQLDFCKDMYKLFYETHYKPNKTSILRLNQMRNQFIKALQKNNSFASHYLWEIVRMLASSGSLILYSELKEKHLPNKR